MAKQDGNTAGAKSVLAEIDERLAAITPEQFIAPKHPPERGFVAVGMANEGIQRLYTLMQQSGEEMFTLGKKTEKLINRIELFTPKNGDVLALLKNLIDSGITKAQIEELQALQDEINDKKMFCEIVRSIFWLEVRHQYPELASKDTIEISDDWSLGWVGDGGHPSLKRLGLGGFGDFLRNRATAH